MAFRYVPSTSIPTRYRACVSFMTVRFRLRCPGHPGSDFHRGDASPQAFRKPTSSNRTRSGMHPSAEGFASGLPRVHSAPGSRRARACLKHGHGALPRRGENSCVAHASPATKSCRQNSPTSRITPLLLPDSAIATTMQLGRLRDALQSVAARGRKSVHRRRFSGMPTYPRVVTWFMPSGTPIPESLTSCLGVPSKNPQHPRHRARLIDSGHVADMAFGHSRRVSERRTGVK